MLAADGHRSVKAARGTDGSRRGLRGIGQTYAGAAICRPALSGPFSPRGPRGRLDLHSAPLCSLDGTNGRPSAQPPALSRLMRDGSINAATSRWSADGDAQRYRKSLSRLTSRPEIGYLTRRGTGCGFDRAQARMAHVCQTCAIRLLLSGFSAPGGHRGRGRPMSGAIAAPAAVARRDAVPRGLGPRGRRYRRGQGATPAPLAPPIGWFLGENSPSRGCWPPRARRRDRPGTTGPDTGGGG